MSFLQKLTLEGLTLEGILNSTSKRDTTVAIAGALISVDGVLNYYYLQTENVGSRWFCKIDPPHPVRT